MSGDHRSHNQDDGLQIDPEPMNPAQCHKQSTVIEPGRPLAKPRIHQRPSQGDSAVSAEFDFSSNTPPELQPDTTTMNPQDTVAPTLPNQTGIAIHESSQALVPEGAEDALSTASEASLTSPALKLTLLCMTGARIVICIDKQFIDLHSLPVKDPESINVGQLKKVIYDEWMNGKKEAETGVDAEVDLTDSEEIKNTASAPKSLANSLDKPYYTRNWGGVLAAAVSPGPASPSHIRLIHLGKVLVDEYTLEEYKINVSNAFHVVHLSIKPDIQGGKDKSASKPKSKLGLRHARSALSASSSRPTHGAADAAEENETETSSGARSGCCCIIS